MLRSLLITKNHVLRHASSLSARSLTHANPQPGYHNPLIFNNNKLYGPFYRALPPQSHPNNLLTRENLDNDILDAVYLNAHSYHDASWLARVLSEGSGSQSGDHLSLFSTSNRFNSGMFFFTKEKPRVYHYEGAGETVFWDRDTLEIEPVLVMGRARSVSSSVLTKPFKEWLQSFQANSEAAIDIQDSMNRIFGSNATCESSKFITR